MALPSFRTRTKHSRPIRHTLSSYEWQRDEHVIIIMLHANMHGRSMFATSHDHQSLGLHHADKLYRYLFVSPPIALFPPVVTMFASSFLITFTWSTSVVNPSQTMLSKDVYLLQPY